MLDSLYMPFASLDFDPNEYANSILAGEQASAVPTSAGSGKLQKTVSSLTSSTEPAKEDLSVVISRLTVGVDDVSKQLKNVVTNNHEALLVQAAGVGLLEEKMRTVRLGLNEVSASQDKLKSKVRVPFVTLSSCVKRLSRLQCAAEALRRVARFVVLARRLEVQMTELENLSSAADGVKNSVNGIQKSTTTSSKKESSGSSDAIAMKPVSEDQLTMDEGEKERAIARAALTVAELVSLLDNQEDIRIVPDNEESSEDPEFTEISLRSIQAVIGHIPAIEDARTKITAEMEGMVLTGLANLNRSLLASSLQTAHNLRVLPNLVRSLLSDLTDAVEQRIKIAFDMARISKEINAKESTPTAQGLLYRSRIRTEPTNVTAPQWSAALWQRLEKLIEELVDCCIKVYTLEKVLQLKKDATTQLNFMDEAMKLLENKPSTTFWTVLAQALEKQCKDTVRSSTFMQQTLSSGYPRLLRLFHEFFAKIAVYTDTVYNREKQSPETVLILKALSVFEQSYLQRSAIRLNEVVAQSVAGGARSPPAMGEGLSIARTAINELDAAKFDPLLVKAVAKNVNSSLELLQSRLDPLIVRDRWATSLLGPVSTPQQTQNAQIATCLFHCASRLSTVEEGYSEGIVAILQPSIKTLQNSFHKLVDPLLAAIRRELATIIAKLHKVDFAKDPDAGSGMGGASPYMKDLVEKLNFIKSEVLARFNVADTSRSWLTVITKDVMRSFVLHASIAKPLGEGGKLQLTSDMTELEFALSAFMAEGGTKNKRTSNISVIGDDYRALRAMRPLLFLENNMLASAEHTNGLPPLIVLHHILVRSPIPLPHSLHGWSEAEYARWVEEHSSEEALTLIDGALTHWEKLHESPAPGTDAKDAKEYLDLAHTILAKAKGLND